MEIISPRRRSGTLVLPEFEPAAEQNFIRVDLPVDPSSISGRVSLTATIEQSPDGVLWWPLGGVGIEDVAEALSTKDKFGNINYSIWLQCTEQIYRADVFRDQKFAQFGGAAYELKDDEDRVTYHQLALCPRIRVTVESFGSLVYGCSVDTLKRAAPPTPIGRRSASLLGVFTAAEAGGGTLSVTSGSRTTTSGSLITGVGSGWKLTSGTTITGSDNKSNTYTKPTNGQVQFSAGAGSFGNICLTYNNAGTRGTTHTYTANFSVGNNPAVGGCEWDGQESSPTVVSASTTGSGTAVSHSVAVSAQALVILIFGYDGSTSTTFSPNGSTQAQEIDENNDSQSCGVYYKVAQTGTPSVAATLAASRSWGAVIVGFTEQPPPAFPCTSFIAYQHFPRLFIEE